MPTDFPPTVVAVKPVGGLASRLKCLASFAVLAEYFGVTLHVCWTASDGFEAVAWDALFAPPPFPVEWIDTPRWQALRSDPTTVALEKHVTYLLTDYKYPFFDLRPLLQTRRPQRLTAACNRELGGVYGDVLHRAIPTFATRMRAYWTAFAPSADVHAIVATQVRTWSTPTTDDTTDDTTETPAAHVLGIHVRRNDALRSKLGRRYLTPTDAEVVAQIATQLARNEGAKQADATGDEEKDAPGDKVEDTKEEGDTNKEEHTETSTPEPTTDAPPAPSSPLTGPHHVFFATDDPDAAAAVAGAYAEHPCVHVFPWRRYAQRPGAPVLGQKKAAADLFALRYCDRVTGTVFSVFTELAKCALHRSAVAVDTGTPVTATATTTEWDDEAEPAHVVAAREAQAKAKTAAIRKVATQVVTEVVDTVLAKLAPPPPVAVAVPVPVAKTKTKAKVASVEGFPVGAHVTVIGADQGKWLGKRGMCLGGEDDRVRVCVDADGGVVITVGVEGVVRV